MPKFDFVGSTEMMFPDVLTGAGSLVCKPGDKFIELDEDPQSPLLVLSPGEKPVRSADKKPARKRRAASSDAPLPDETHETAEETSDTEGS